MKKQILEIAVESLRDNGWCAYTRGQTADGYFTEGEDPEAVQRCVLGALDWGYVNAHHMDLYDISVPGEWETSPEYMAIVEDLVLVAGLDVAPVPVMPYAHRKITTLADWNNEQADGSLIIQAMERLLVIYEAQEAFGYGASTITLDELRRELDEKGNRTGGG